MNEQNTASLKKYVELVARKYGGLEGLRHTIGSKLTQESPLGLEANPENEGTNIAARKALESLESDRELERGELLGLEAIISAEIRPVIDVIDGRFNSTHPLWTQLSTDDGIRGRLEACMSSIGRVELPGHRLPYGGTAFLVGEGLLMTNRHVAEIFAAGLGTRSLAFKPGAQAGIDFLRELNQPPGTIFKVTRVVMIHPYWDMALLQVEGLDSRRKLGLSLIDARDIQGHDIAVIGYPAFDPRNPSDVQQGLFHGNYGVKRLQPGELQGGKKTASFQKLVNAATHDCSTLGGNSGSCLIDLDTGAVLALHFGGSYREQNFAVPTSELARDQRIVDAGVNFVGTPHPDDTDWATWWRRADAGQREETATDRSEQQAPTTPDAPRGNNTLTIEIPLRISISVGTHRVLSAQAEAPVESITGDELEALREPEHDSDYSSRRGYDPLFLNTPGLPAVQVPMPSATDPQILAKTLEGKDILHYQNFSIRMHAARKLALVTGSNVTREPTLRNPEPGRDYTRKGLSNLGKNDMEKWFLDPRLDAAFQIPDVFFTKDRQAFDKGHIVRRDDVAWGNTYDELKRANGDSYHVTNCSPQVAGFNRSNQGDDNWGDLENYVLADAANERLCIFAGPVFDPHDPIFHGVGEGGRKLQARIPSRFWKLIVARNAIGIASYGFVLEQNLSDVQFEFAVPAVFERTMHPLSDIQEMTGVSFAQSLLDADQFNSVRGIELAQRSNINRKHP
ncbi:DNA/RNA non-specific endonuclease [Zoogloea sp. LCSB751]|uniref:DNA/RNA non-specific endonuclease n=1 Tax=Zoogloea sp. LCSB751 TaxID=1965277 RepID=UPI0009A51940|nr:DNA/RNA non-specific endonuclease [Zoogloea sp. LCSB751]